MAYRKLGRDNKHRRSMLATLTKQLILNERIVTTETRAKEVRKTGTMINHKTVFKLMNGLGLKSLIRAKKSAIPL